MNRSALPHHNAHQQIALKSPSHSSKHKSKLNYSSRNWRISRHRIEFKKLAWLVTLALSVDRGPSSGNQSVWPLPQQRSYRHLIVGIRVQPKAESNQVSISIRSEICSKSSILRGPNFLAMRKMTKPPLELDQRLFLIAFWLMEMKLLPRVAIGTRSS